MKVFLLILMLSQSLFAAVKLQFFPGDFQGMISVTESDAKTLLNAMNVPWQNSIGGPGKGLYSSDRVFNLVCGEQNGRGVLCTLVIQQSSHSQIDSQNRRIHYQTSGDEAKNLKELFVYNSTNGFSFVSSDQKLQIESTENQFEMQAFQ